MKLTRTAVCLFALLSTWTIIAIAMPSSRAADPPERALSGSYPFVFRDVGDAAGLFPHIAGIRGHGAAWGDVDGDGWPDLFVATFHNFGSKASLFVRNNKGTFRFDDQKHLRSSGIGSGALFVDLTNSGRLDLFVSHCAYGRAAISNVPSLLFRNDGGKFTDVSKESGISLPGYMGRGVAALDFDGDGHLDLVTCERYYGAVKFGPAVHLHGCRPDLRF